MPLLSLACSRDGKRSPPHAPCTHRTHANLPNASLVQLPSLEALHFAPSFRKAAFGPLSEGSALSSATTTPLLRGQRRREREQARDGQEVEEPALAEGDAEEDAKDAGGDEGEGEGSDGGAGQQERRVFGGGGSL